jgi:hypothetical protein
MRRKMKDFDKYRSVVYAVIIGVLLTPGIIILGWQFQILSYKRLINYSLMCIPFTVIGTIIFNRFYPINISSIIKKQSAIIFLICLSANLLVTPFTSDIIHYVVVIITATIWFFFITSAFIKVCNSGHENFLRSTYLILLGATGLIGILFYLYMALFVRLYGDDFCFINQIRSSGLITTLINFYYSWSGRWFSDIFMIGLSSVRILPLIEIALLVVFTFIASHMINIESKPRSLLQNIVVALFLPFALFSSTPDPYKSLYWNSNVQTIFPVSLVTVLFIAFMVRGFLKGFRHETLSVFAAFIMALVISSGHEIVIPAIILISASFLVYSIFVRKSQNYTQVKVSIGALIGSIIGSLSLVLAPGNYARIAYQGYSSAPNILSAIVTSFGFYVNFLSSFADNWKWVLLLSAFIAGIISKTILPKNWKIIAFTVLVMIGISWGTFFISAYAISKMLPTRTQFIPTLFLVYGIFSLGLMFPLPKIDYKMIAISSIILCLLGTVFIQVIANEHAMVNPIVQYSRDWDDRDQALRLGKTKLYYLQIPWDSIEQAKTCINAYYYSK